MTTNELPYEIVIGLEVHVQLLTATKLFCGCGTEFGATPNTLTCPVCLGLPGTLPVMNRRAFELSLKTAAALNCTLAPFTKWDRKQYYYPDLPKGYQISQYDLPFSSRGHIDIYDSKGRFEPRPIRINRVHLEEDAGKSIHDEQAGRADSRIDLNRTGTPLMEIVSEPDMRSPLEAKAYLTELKLLLTYLGVSDCNMQEGSLRVDANINLHVHAADGGDKIATPIVEVKNMNSFRAVERALAYEAERHYRVFQETGQRLGDVPKQTRGWDESAGVTRAQRQKEESSDYRYFPDPDLAPVIVTAEQVQAVHESLGELPAALRHRLEATHGITSYDADVLVNQGRPVVNYYLEVAEACGDGKLAANWMQQDVLRTLNERGIGIDAFPIEAGRLAAMLSLITAGELHASRAREVFERLLATAESPADAMTALGIVKVDENALVAICRELIAENPKLVDDIRAGKMKAAGAFIGAAKKKNPNVDPVQVKDLCLELIASEAG